MDSKNRLEHIIHCLVEYRKMWLLPAIAGLVLSTFYAFFIQGETWTSRQSMIIRDDLLGSTFKPGSFISEEAMKSAQETVLATARRPEVIRKTLEALGPDNSSLLGFGGGSGSDWPSNQVIEDFRGSVSFESANGGEFGKSEVIVLAAKGSSPQRSVEFLSILMDEVDAKLSEIQGDRFESMEAELRATRDSTMRSREAMESDLVKMESGFEGTDIHLVKSLNERAGGSPSAFENKLNEIAKQRREAVRQLSELNSNRRFLIQAGRDSASELPTSAELLASQPALSEMVTGLAKAKQELADASEFQPAHWKVKKGREKVATIKRQIQQSIGTIVRGLDNQIEVQENRVSILDEMLEENTRRLRSVSRKRAPYATLSREVDKLNEDYSEASARLTRMRSRKMASASIKLLTRIGEPWIGTRADGMGKRSIALVGGIAGLIIGLGLVMMVAPPFVDPNQPVINQAEATTESEDDSILRQLGGIVPRHQDEAIQHHETFEEDGPLEQESDRENEIIVERETVPQRQAQPEPQVQLPAQAEAETQLVSASLTQAPELTPPVSPQIEVPVQQQETVADLVAGESPLSPVSPSSSTENSLTDSNPQPSTQPTPQNLEPSDPFTQQPLPPQSPSIVVIPDAQSTDPARSATIMPSQQAPAQPQQTVESQADTQQAPSKRPGAKTLAAIFANMPQPKTDLAEPTTNEPVGNPEPTSADSIGDKIAELTTQPDSEPSQTRPQSPTVREATQTIQLDGNIVKPAIPLQRRSTVRPVDLAKSEASVNEQSIDNVFSQLIPPRTLPREETDTELNDS